MEILYFSWVRELIGVGRERRVKPDAVTDVASLLGWLSAISDGHAAAFADSGRIRVAVNQEHVGLTHPVEDGDEVALFPPVTGG